MPKFGLRKLLRRYWGVLTACCVLLGLALCFGIELKTTPRARETFCLFMDFPNGEVNAFELESHIKEVDPVIKRASALSFDPASSDYQTYCSTWAQNSDLLLFSSEYLAKKDMGEFAVLDSLDASDAYQVGGVSYGLKAQLSENPYFEAKEGTYYCFFRKSSVHLGALDEASQSDLCLVLAKELFHALP